MNRARSGPHVPEAQPTRQGRMLIRMLFRSSGDDDKGVDSEEKKNNNQTECSLFWKQPVDLQVSREQQTPVSKFASLKRKLFPFQNRRHPRQVPALINPINAPANASLPPLNDGLKALTDDLGTRGNEENSEHSQATRDLSLSKKNLILRRLEFKSPDDIFEITEGDIICGTANTDSIIDDDDNRDFEHAVEALDLESSIADKKTLQDMSNAIDELRAWKEAHAQETQDAMDKLLVTQVVKEELYADGNEQPQDATENDYLFEQQQRDREAQAITLKKEAEAYQRECNLLQTKLGESEATRMEQALQITDFEGLALSRLRNEVFQLDVKQRQEALLLELQGADAELDMNIADVQAFTGELDAILAQFDDVVSS